jgi:hypothetical protein
VTETNVLKVFRFLTGVPRPDLDRQIKNGASAPLVAEFGSTVSLGEVVYLAGVGSVGAGLKRAWQGATGTGTTERILEAYRFLADRWRPRDRIFGFGFSRGAFAVRSLAGLIRHCGLPAQGTCDQAWLDDVYAAYRTRDGSQSPLKAHECPAVEFLGLWDTVGALAFRASLAAFHDTSPTNVQRVAHALAMDERRAAFEPEFWAGSPGHGRIDEIWFPGAHSNIGGGYANEQLSNVALAWVIAEAVDAGLIVRRTYIDEWYKENANAKARDAHAEFLMEWKWLGDWLKGEPVTRCLGHQHGVHRSVFARMERDRESEYVTVPFDGSPLPEYQPVATMPNGRTMLDRGAFAAGGGRIVETADYLQALP